MAAALTGPQRPFTQPELDECLTALVAFAGNARLACEYLEAEGKRAPHHSTLGSWARTKHWERYQQLRAQWADKVEDAVTHDMRDAARASLEVARLAVEKARDRLEANKDEDPARTAANLSRVAQSSTDKYLALTGRPSSITETRSNPDEILRSLVSMGVLQAPVDSDAEEPPALEEG